MELDRVPPQSLESEKNIISGCINGKGLEIGKKISPEFFYSLKNKMIIIVIQELIANGEEISAESIIEPIMEMMPGTGIENYLIEIEDMEEKELTIYKFNYRTVLECFVRREIIKICIQTIDKLHDESLSVSLLIDEAEKAISTIRKKYYKYKLN